MLKNKQDWQPAATQDAIKARSALLKALRAFFYARDYLEVDTPCLSHSGTTDANIDSLTATSTAFGNLWLQTSPEFAMKRLLAAQSGPIFQIAHAFREGEAGRWHNPEFSLLEWYVPGFDHEQLMQEVEQLLRHLAPQQAWAATFQRLSYRDCFWQYLALDPFKATVAQLESCAEQQNINLNSQLDHDAWLDLLMGECIGPQLGLSRPCFIVDYPASQAALARLRPANAEDEPVVASRFELYWQGLELANGFHELKEASEQRQRFETDQKHRAQQQKVIPPIDEHLLAALQAGLPDCAGVALGIDRLLALLLGKEHLAEVMCFPIDRN